MLFGGISMLLGALRFYSFFITEHDSFVRKVVLAHSEHLGYFLPSISQYCKIIFSLKLSASLFRYSKFSDMALFNYFYIKRAD